MLRNVHVLTKYIHIVVAIFYRGPEESPYVPEMNTVSKMAPKCLYINTHINIQREKTDLNVI